MSDCMYTADRRVFLVLLASGVAISAWALFPTTVERGIYVPLPETSTPSAADVKSAREGVVGSPVNTYTTYTLIKLLICLSGLYF